MRIEINNAAHGALIAAAIPRPYDAQHSMVISRVTSEGNCLGGVIYDDYTVGCIFMHQASFGKNWLTGNMIWMVFDYPFNQLKVKKVAGVVNSTNHELLAFNQRLGFKEEARIKDAYADGDMIILTMERSECRWLKIKPKVYMNIEDPTDE